MFVVIFEVQPRDGRWDEYLTLATALRPAVESIDGFIDNERFMSTRTQGRALSLSTWRDEAALSRWRTHVAHRRAQQLGRSVVFDDYRLRVGAVTSDTLPPAGTAVSISSSSEALAGTARAVTLTEVSAISPTKATALLQQVPAPLGNGAKGVIDYELFESIYNPGKVVLLASFDTAASAQRFAPTAVSRHRQVHIIRDYGMSDRAQAPQVAPTDEVSSPRPAHHE